MAERDKILRDSKGRFIKGMTPWCKGLTKETDERIKRIAKSKTGKNYYNWKGGRVKHPSGAIKLSKNGKQFWEHHYVWCVHNEFPIIPYGCEIHHIDLNPSNNSPDNLVLLPSDTHRKLHYEIQLMQNPDRIYFGVNQNMRGVNNGR